MIYIAGPFFNEEQISLIEAIEAVLIFNNIPHYSPRSEGVLFNMTREEKLARMDYIFNKNVEMLNECDTVIAVIDNYDTGTVWELGYAFAKNKRIITITDHCYTLNIMIRNCVEQHCMRVEELPQAIANKGNNQYKGDVI